MKKLQQKENNNPICGYGNGRTSTETLPLREYIKILRKEHGYSQQYVADYLHVIRQTYSHYETGRLIPPVNVLYGLARLYDIKISELIEHTPEGIEERYPRQKNININTPHETDETGEDELLMLYGRLSTDQKKSLLVFLEGIV